MVALNDGNSSDSLTYANALGSLQSLIMEESLVMDSLIEIADSIKIEFADSLMSINSEIADSTLILSNLKAFNELFLNTIGKNRYILTYTEDSIAFSIASQCALQGGDPVIAMRSLYYLMNDTIEFDDSTICSESADDDRHTFVNGLSSTSKFVSGFKISPNPVEDYLYINGNENKERGLFVTIYDLQGRTIGAWLLTGETIQRSIPVVDLKAGTYIIMLRIDKMHVNFARFVKLN